MVWGVRRAGKQNKNRTVSPILTGQMREDNGDGRYSREWRRLSGGNRRHCAGDDRRRPGRSRRHLLKRSRKPSTEEIDRLVEQLGDGGLPGSPTGSGQIGRIGLQGLRCAGGCFDGTRTWEIASRARYLFQLMEMEWIAESDPRKVKEILTDFHQLSVEERLAKIEQLADLPDGQGVAGAVPIGSFREIDRALETCGAENHQIGAVRRGTPATARGSAARTFAAQPPGPGRQLLAINVSRVARGSQSSFEQVDQAGGSGAVRRWRCHSTVESPDGDVALCTTRPCWRRTGKNLAAAPEERGGRR